MAITDATNPQTRSNDTPVTNTTPIIGDLDLSLDLPPVVKEASTPDTDWLKEEDKLVQNDTTNVSTIGNDATEGSPALAGEDLKTEAKDEVLQDNLPQSAKAMTLQDDMKIIQEIQNVELIKTQPQERILEAKKLDPSEVTA